MKKWFLLLIFSLSVSRSYGYEEGATLGDPLKMSDLQCASVSDDSFDMSILEKLSADFFNDWDEEEGKEGYLYQAYLQHGDLDPILVCKKFFPKMTPEQVNVALRDIRKFIENFINLAVTNYPSRVGEKFLADILHTYGHVITFIDNAWVDRKTKRVFVPEDQESTRYADPILDYWWFAKNARGEKLHVDKFNASCIDLLTIMIGSYLRFPCYDRKQKDEMENRWLWWLEKVTRKIMDSPIFGGYYQANAKDFREVCALWVGDYRKKQELKRKRLFMGR